MAAAKRMAQLSNQGQASGKRFHITIKQAIYIDDQISKIACLLFAFALNDEAADSICNRDASLDY